MKSLFRPFLLALALLFPLSAARAEVIDSFDAQIHAQKDSSLLVTETVAMDFESAQRHGIYRVIPIKYSRNGGNYSIYLNVLSVTDENGAAYHYSKSRQGRDLSIKIGDADSTITGKHTYVLKYMVRRAVNFFNGAPEFYWNATGNEWPFAMKRASARFFPPPGVAISSLKTASYFGPPGSTTPALTQNQADSVLFYTYNLRPGDGLTIVAAMPAGSVTKPSALQNFLWFFADWWPLFVFPIFTGALITAQWNRSGRDIEGGMAAQVEWAPPKDLSPAEVGTLIDESCDMTDIISTLIDLAARGYLRIEEIQTTKILFLHSKDYAFHRTHGYRPDDVLAPHETIFLRGLFGTDAAGDNMVMMSSLKNHFYVYLPQIRDSIYSGLLQKRLFTTNPETTRSRYQIAGVVMGALGLVMAVALAAFSGVAYGVGLALSGLIVLLSARAMPAKTATGSRKLRECQGFQRFVSLAERGRIEKMIQDDPTIFGRLLPYAMVLGVGDEWANKFVGLMTEPPDWYSGGSYNNFSTAYFVSNLGSGMNSMGQTFQSQPAPQSSGGSGGSGFSGGGSGGGFGGGGGGSW